LAAAGKAMTDWFVRNVEKFVLCYKF